MLFLVPIARTFVLYKIGLIPLTITIHASPLLVKHVVNGDPRFIVSIAKTYSESHRWHPVTHIGELRVKKLKYVSNGPDLSQIFPVIAL